MGKNRKLIYILTPHNHNSVYKYLGYTFTFDRNLKPIPVEVPEEVAEILLKVQTKLHVCCKNKPRIYLFKEVIE